MSSSVFSMSSSSFVSPSLLPISKIFMNGILKVFECQVCLEFDNAAKSYACFNGHLACEPCMLRVLADAALGQELAMCPTCRCEISWNAITECKVVHQIMSITESPDDDAKGPKAGQAIPVAPKIGNVTWLKDAFFINWTSSYDLCVQRTIFKSGGLFNAFGKNFCLSGCVVKTNSNYITFGTKIREIAFTLVCYDRVEVPMVMQFKLRSQHLGIDTNFNPVSFEAGRLESYGVLSLKDRNNDANRFLLSESIRFEMFIVLETKSQ